MKILNSVSQMQYGMGVITLWLCWGLVEAQVALIVVCIVGSGVGSGQVLINSRHGPKSKEEEGERHKTSFTFWTDWQRTFNIFPILSFFELHLYSEHNSIPCDLTLLYEFAQNVIAVVWPKLLQLNHYSLKYDFW